MMHARVLGEYIYFALIYKTGIIFPDLPIKHLVNHDGVPTTPHKLAAGTNLQYQTYVFIFSFVLQKATSRIDTKELNIFHQSEKGFGGIFVGIPQYQKGNLIYVPGTQKIFYSHDVAFEKVFLVCMYTRHIHI